ncbi:MAG: ATP-binding protein [Desulfobacteraceae bacterium]|nr:ATP-binding protein [Desulfobacteraceae bacterium]
MKNPFIVTGVVDDPAFCNRVKERAELRTHIENSQNVLLYSHRRYGKTSLILKVFRELRGVTPIYVDLYGTTSIEGFIKAFLKGTSAIEPKTEKFMKIVRESLSGISLALGFDPISSTPTFNLSFDRKAASLDIGVIFQLAQKLAKKKKIVIAFDEFQEIANYGGEPFEKELRKVIQHHDNISYLFSGSQRHIVMAMFHDAKRAFYQMAINMHLDRINTEDFLIWIQGLCQQADKIIDEMVIRDVVARCEQHPKYVQEFFYMLWPLKKVGTDEVNRTESEILEERSIEFMNAWDSFSLNQKRALKLVAATEGEQLFSAENLVRFQFKTASQVTAAIKYLEERDFLAKNGVYKIQDPIFRRWVQRMV